MSRHEEGAHDAGHDADEDLFDAGGDDAADAEGDDPEDGDDEDAGAAGDEDADDDRQSIEALAVEAGWKPKAKWKGEGWVPASQFLKNAAKNASRAKREVRDMQARMDALEGAHQASLDRTVKQLEAKAKAMKADAIKSGGKDAVKIVEEIDEALAEEKAKLAAQHDDKPVQLTPLDKKFFAENDWMVSEDSLDDDELAAEADEAFELVRVTVADAHKKGKTAIEAYELAERALRRAYPHRYDDEDDERPRRGKAKTAPGRRKPDLAGGRRAADDDGAGDSAARLVAKLPPEARRAGQDYVTRGTFGSLAEYAEVYFSELKKERRA